MGDVNVARRVLLKRSGFLWCVVGFGTLGSAFGQRIVYVRYEAPGLNDGSSWTNAYTDLQGALEDARAGGDNDAEIWIATGTYKADRGTGDQRMAFELFGTIKLYGGFAGDETHREEREPTVHVTILSGDLNDDDILGAPVSSDCCSWELPGMCTDVECRTAVEGQSSRCAGMWTDYCNTLAFHLCGDLCRPTRGDNSYNVIRSTEPGSSPTLDGLTVQGGEAFGYDASQVWAWLMGAFYARESDAKIVGCTFRQNRGSEAGAFYSELGTPFLERTSLLDNGVGFPSTAALIRYPASHVTLRRLNLIDHAGDGLRLLGAVATVEECSILNNRRGLFCWRSDCTVVRTLFAGNGEGMFAEGVSRIIDSEFRSNSEHGLFTWGQAIVSNCVFAGNTGSTAAALDSFSGTAYVFNSVFFRNSANFTGGMVCADGGCMIRNSIFWGNSHQDSRSQYAQLYASTETAIDISNCIVQGWTGSWGGVGNSGDDPVFVDPDGPDDIPGTEDDNLRLLPGSPGINAGSLSTSFLPATDLDGHARILCGTVDLGPYEFGIGDFDCSQAVNLADFAEWPTCMTGPHGGPYEGGCEAFDADADGDLDLLDFAGFSMALAAP